MHSRKTGLFAALVFFLVPTFLLATGSSWLMAPVGSIPAGTFITWVGMIALPMVFYFSFAGVRQPRSSADKKFSWAWKACLFLAISWVPVSYLLAGNFSFTFSEKTTFQGGQTAMQLFWYFTYTVVLAPLIWWIFKLIGK